MVQARTWKDPSPGLSSAHQGNLDGVTVFKTLYIVYFQWDFPVEWVSCISETFWDRYFHRFNSSIRNHPEILSFAERLAEWFDIWYEGVSAPVSTFADPITSSTTHVRSLTLEKLREDVMRLRTIIRRESGVAEELRRPFQKPVVTAAHKHRALMTHLMETFDPPGHLRDDGPRHDNDFADISRIRIAPTQAELLCPLVPFLPPFLPDAPHHLPASSMQKHLDIQFRLLREELM
jgi:hypothetical protein